MHGEKTFSITGITMQSGSMTGYFCKQGVQLKEEWTLYYSNS